jgi:hypothetical protein
LGRPPRRQAGDSVRSRLRKLGQLRLEDDDAVAVEGERRCLGSQELHWDEPAAHLHLEDDIFGA